MTAQAPYYHEGSRPLQDQFGSRPLADRLEQVAVHTNDRLCGLSEMP
jgi:hypothetical protein